LCYLSHNGSINKMRNTFFLFVFLTLLVLSGCGKQGSTCPTGSSTEIFLTVPPERLPSPTSGPAPTPVIMEIRGKSVTVDKVVEGPLCNDTWSGTVYVACNIQVYPWEKSPDFLRNCKLNIEPGTIVYVAQHNDSAYYNGCSCHTGEIAEP
jgi:hypothetical protein